jgi:hypothetical protein
MDQRTLQALIDNQLVTLGGNRCGALFHSLETVSFLTNEGAIKLSEALKLNTSLTSLELSCNSDVETSSILTQYRHENW